MKYLLFIKTNKNISKGFSLVEILIATAIFALIVVIIASFQVKIFEINDFMQFNLSVQQDARKILRPFAEEVRSATISNLGNYPIEVATQNEIVFYSDIDNDGLKDRVRYFRDGDSFKKGVISPTGDPYEYVLENEEIADVVLNLSNGPIPVFTYYDGSYDGNINNEALNYPVSLNEITMVEAKLIIESDDPNVNSSIEISSKATFRNLKD